MLGNSTETVIHLAEGKYTVRHNAGLDLRASRYGEPWRDLVGDGLVLAMAQEIDDLKNRVTYLEHVNEELHTQWSDIMRDT